VLPSPDEYFFNDYFKRLILARHSLSLVRRFALYSLVKHDNILNQILHKVQWQRPQVVGGIINTQSCKFPGKSAGKNNFENRLRFHRVVAMRFYWDTVYYTGNFDTFKTSVSVNPYCIPIYDQKRICPSIFSQILSPVSDYVIGFLIYFTFR